MRARILCGVLCALGLGCRQDMHDNPRHEPLEHSAFFADGRASRPQVLGTVARGELALDPVLKSGRRDGQPVRELPIALTPELLRRGRERYDIFCSPCHDRAGYGNGMVVQRGMTRPPSLHVERLRAAPVGYIFGVITNGFGVMYDYADRLAPEDRWAVVAWVRTLQLSQHASTDDLPPVERARLEALQ